MLERLFKLNENGTSWKQEFIGGTTTFMTMAYIVFVQPVILGAAGMDMGAVMAATCLSSAIATFCMGLMANYPIALAPGMGANVFFAYTVVLTQQYPWQQVLGAIFVSGILFVLLSFVGLREAIVNSLPPSLKHAIAVGIGLLISVVGLEWAGIVVANPGTLIGLGHLAAPPTLLSLLGLAVTSALLLRGFRSAVLVGILVTLLAALVSGQVRYEGIVSPAPSLSPTLFKLDVPGILQPGMVAIVFVFFFLDLFDTVGTLTGVSQEGGFLQSDGTLPRAREALLADAFGTVTGSLLGTSTVTSYVESAAGINAGARTGLANIVTGTLFLLALFFSPLLRMIGGGVEGDPEGLRLFPIIAPALIIIGCVLIRSIRKIDWDDYSEAIPAFLTILMMPLTFSPTEGISFGFISFTFLKAVRGRIADVPPLIRVFAVLFVFRYILL